MSVTISSPPVPRPERAGEPRRHRGSRYPRDLLLWLHVVSSVCWMAQALSLGTLNLLGVTTTDDQVRLSAFTMARHLDHTVLVYAANTSAFTGLMLAALTSWGYFRYWWVLVKFAITLSQLYVGIFILSPRMEASVLAAERGESGPAGPLTVAALLMASAIAFQAWLSVAKPWRRTPWANGRGRPAKLPTAPGWVFGVCFLIPIVDVALAFLVFERPMPTLSLLTAIGYPIRRALRLRRAPTRSQRRSLFR